MATFLDIGLLRAVGDIFPFILVFAIVYGILTSTKVFGKNKGLQAIVAFMVAFMTIFIPNLTKVIKLMTPWFTVLFIFILFVLIIVKLFGGTDEMIKDSLDIKKSSVLYWILIFSFVIFLGSLGSVYFNPDNTPETVTIENGSVVQRGETGEQGQSAFWATFFHPKILGMIMILLIATFASITITKEMPPK